VFRVFFPCVIQHFSDFVMNFLCCHSGRSCTELCLLSKQNNKQLTPLSLVELRINYQIKPIVSWEAKIVITTDRGAHEDVLQFLLAPSPSLMIETYLSLSNLWPFQSTSLTKVLEVLIHYCIHNSNKKWTHDHWSSNVQTMIWTIDVIMQRKYFWRSKTMGIVSWAFWSYKKVPLWMVK